MSIERLWKDLEELLLSIEDDLNREGALLSARYLDAQDRVWDWSSNPGDHIQLVLTPSLVVVDNDGEVGLDAPLADIRSLECWDAPDPASFGPNKTQPTPRCVWVNHPERGWLRLSVHEPADK